MSEIDLTTDQKRIYEALNGKDSLCITGSAGTGKSYVFGKWLDSADHRYEIPILASTGAAAVLLGGRTFHSFFGLGVMQGPVDRIILSAVGRPSIQENLLDCDAIAIDEISMISAEVLGVAEAIARTIRRSEEPWGGLRVIVSGDFLQLPPVSKAGEEVHWAFLGDVWEKTGFKVGMLREIVRTSDRRFSEILNHIRYGNYDMSTYEFLKERFVEHVEDDFEGTRLYPRRDQVAEINHRMLAQLPDKEHTFHTTFRGDQRYRRSLVSGMPVPEILSLKKGALVMIRRNALDLSYVNGTLATVVGFEPDRLIVKLLENEREITLNPTTFDWYDGAGEVALSARNFPVTLAWACTIHKAQGATINRVSVDLRSIWEPGQAYVALSRVRKLEDLHVEGWDNNSIGADPLVVKFYQRLEAQADRVDQLHITEDFYHV